MTDAITLLGQVGGELALAHRLLALGLDQGLEFGQATRPVDEGQVTADVVFLEVGDQRVGIPLPGAEQTVDAAEPLVTGLPPQRLDRLQARVAAGRDHVARRTRPAGDGQGLLHARGPDRRLDLFVAVVGQLAWVVVVDVDLIDLHHHRGRLDRIGRGHDLARTPEVWLRDQLGQLLGAGTLLTHGCLPGRSVRRRRLRRARPVVCAASCGPVGSRHGRLGIRRRHGRGRSGRSLHRR